MEQKITEKDAEKIFDENSVPEEATIKGAPFILSAEVDMTPQPLRKIRPAYRARAAINPLLPDIAKIVISLLFDCFERQGNVQEGLIGDVLWGFEQPVNGLPPEVTFHGLNQLRLFGYLKFQAPDGSFIGPESGMIGKAWVRYEPKLLEMVYE